MDTTQSTSDSDSFATPAALLVEQLRGAAPPLLIDVRKNEAFASSSYLLAGALRRDPRQVEQWAADLPQASTVLVYCIHGLEVGRNTMTALRQRGINASFLQGGIEAWRKQSLPLLAKPPGGGTRWVTREHPKIDRIACPWLIRRFVDAQAQFLYVPAAQVAAVAAREAATAYDVGPQVASTVFTHAGERCSFDAFIQHYRLGQDAALQRLALIVRGADTDRLELAPQCAGLLALSLGMGLNCPDDGVLLETMLPIYDALYAWCREAVAGRDEKHNWQPA